MKESTNSPQSDPFEQLEQLDDRDLEPLKQDENPFRALSALIKRGYTKLSFFTILEDRIEKTVEVRIRLSK